MVILVVCAINSYFVIVYVSALNSVPLYVLSAIFSIAYLGFVGYLVGTPLSPQSYYYTDMFLLSWPTENSISSQYFGH